MSTKLQRSTSITNQYRRAYHDANEALNVCRETLFGERKAARIVQARCYSIGFAVGAALATALVKLAW